MIRTITASGPLHGIVRLPGDKSISHRYAILAALAEGKSELRHFASSRDCHSTLDCLRATGVECHEHGDCVTISGVGLHGLRAPETMLDAGNSGTTIRLLSGVLAGQPFESSITGDESLQSRPMGRILEPLRRMGAIVEARDGNLPPLRIRGGELRGIRYSLPVASAQVKSCVLFAGLYGSAPTAVEEKVPTRDHTEIALRHFGAVLQFQNGWIEVAPEPRLEGRQLHIPGDLSGAAFFMIAAALIPGSDLRIPGVGLNPRRRELLTYLEDAGLDISIENEAECAGEARGDLTVKYREEVRHRALPPIRQNRTAALIDEIPVLAVLGSRVEGGLEVSDARELRIKESDRIAAIAGNLRAFGAAVEEHPDGFRVRGPQELRGCEVVTRGDHRIAMAFAIAGLIACGETRILDAECAGVSFPGFFGVLDTIRSNP